MKARLWLVSIALLLCPVFAHAQGLGSIVGTLTDSTGAAVGSAKVTATQTSTGLSREAISNGDGYFVLSSLSPTDYSLTVEAQGFRGERQAVTLLADQSFESSKLLAVQRGKHSIKFIGLKFLDCDPRGLAGD